MKNVQEDLILRPFLYATSQRAINVRFRTHRTEIDNIRLYCISERPWDHSKIYIHTCTYRSSFSSDFVGDPLLEAAPHNEMPSVRFCAASTPSRVSLPTFTYLTQEGKGQVPTRGVKRRGRKIVVERDGTGIINVRFRFFLER